MNKQGWKKEAKSYREACLMAWQESHDLTIETTQLVNTLDRITEDLILANTTDNEVFAEWGRLKQELEATQASSTYWLERAQIAEAEVEHLKIKLALSNVNTYLQGVGYKGLL